jgi:hypothetical protein
MSITKEEKRTELGKSCVMHESWRCISIRQQAGAYAQAAAEPLAAVEKLLLSHLMAMAAAFLRGHRSTARHGGTPSLRPKRKTRPWWWRLARTTRWGCVRPRAVTAVVSHMLLGRGAACHVSILVLPIY